MTSIGFASGSLAGEGASNLGRLTILQARTSPALAMGDDLLSRLDPTAFCRT